MPKTDEQRPEGWTLLSAVQPGQFVTYRFKDRQRARVRVQGRMRPVNSATLRVRIDEDLPDAVGRMEDSWSL